MVVCVCVYYGRYVTDGNDSNTDIDKAHSTEQGRSRDCCYCTKWRTLLGLPARSSPHPASCSCLYQPHNTGRCSLYSVLYAPVPCATLVVVVLDASDRYFSSSGVAVADCRMQNGGGGAVSGCGCVCVWGLCLLSMAHASVCVFAARCS